MNANVESVRRWAAEPHTFVRQVFRAEPDPWQLAELEALPAADRVAVAGSKGCAKTTWMSWAIWWSLATQVNCQAVATSVSGPQLKDGLWKELAKWYGRSPLLQDLFEMKPERIHRSTEQGRLVWFCSARTWRKDADPNTQAQTLAGVHGRNVLFVIDEAGGVPPVLLATADAVLATKQPRDQIRILIGGNTTSQKGALYSALTRQRDMWRVRRVTSDPDDPMRTPRVSAEWARQQIKAHGRDNPWVKINVFAEFPEEAVGKLLSLAEIEAAFERKVDEDPFEPLVLGVDVGTVADAAVIYPRRGRLLMRPLVLRGQSTTVVAAEVVKTARDSRATAVFIDAGGPGIGVIDQCRAMGLQVVPVFFGGAADDPQRYHNKRVEMMVRLAQWTKEGGAIVQCDELVQDLIEPETSWNLKGQQLLEPKDEVKERLGRSTDWGDAAALTFAYPVASSARDRGQGHEDVVAAMRRQHSQSWDEFGFGG